MNILPPMMTVWYHFARKYLGDSVDITIFDSSGTLKKEDFPGARVQKFLNLYAATKSDEFLYHIAKHRKIGWICDDDVFFVGNGAVDLVKKELSDPKTASLSFRPRNWWHYEIDGKEYPVSSSYCTAINREIYCDKEHLTLGPDNGNPHISHLNQEPVGRYDTFDKANEILIEKGYRCAVVPEADRKKFIAPYSGLSGPVMLLWYFKNPEQTLDYFLTPPKKKWRGSMLFGILSGMLAICTILELYEKIKGQPYLLRSMPKRSDLEKIRKEHKQYIRDDQDFSWIDEVDEQLRAAL